MAGFLIWPHNGIFLENTLSLCRKIFEHYHYVQNFPPVPEMLSIIQSDPFHWATAFFQMVLEIHNLSLCSKIIEHCHFVQTFTPFDEMSSKIRSNPWATIFFYDLFYSVIHIRLNIGPTFRLSICHSVSFSVRQSASHWILQSFSEPSPGSELVYFCLFSVYSPVYVLPQRVLHQLLPHLPPQELSQQDKEQICLRPVQQDVCNLGSQARASKGKIHFKEVLRLFSTRWSY